MATRSVLIRVSVSVAGRMEWTRGASRCYKFSSVRIFSTSDAFSQLEDPDELVNKKKEHSNWGKSKEEKKKKKKDEKEKEDADKKSGGSHYG